MSEIEQIQKDIARIKRDIQFQKNYMERPGKKLTPTKTSECMYRLIQGRERLAAAKKAFEKAGGVYMHDEAEVRASDFLENLPYLNKLTFEIGGYFGGYCTYSVEAVDSRIQGGLFKYLVDGEKRCSILPDPSLIQDPEKPILMIKTLEDLGDYLQELHMEEWMPEYWPDRFGVSVCDGTQWSLKIEFSNGHPAWEAYGSNSYPYNFDDFQKLFGLWFDDDE